MQDIAFDSPRHYTQARFEDADDQSIREAWIAHERGVLKSSPLDTIYTLIDQTSAIPWSEP
jgi:hypothetical protein